MELSRADWAAHVAEWRESGESATRYCEEHGLKLGSLRYWSGRIGRTVSEGPSEAEVRFAEVRRSSSAARPTSGVRSGVRVRLGEVALELEVGFDEETLARAVRALGTAGPR